MNDTNYCIKWKYEGAKLSLCQEIKDEKNKYQTFYKYLTLKSFIHYFGVCQDVNKTNFNERGTANKKKSEFFVSPKK